METEQELISRCLRGHADAWDELFDQHYSLTARFLFQLSPIFTADDVEDICQEVFLSVVRNLASFQRGSALQTWICRIAANKARDHIDKQRAAKRGGGEVPFSLDAENPVTGAKLDPPSGAPPPDRELMNAEEMLQVREALDRLGDPCREIIELKYFADLSYDQIAAELKLNPKTVSSRLSKCLDKLEALAAPLRQPLRQRENMAQSAV